MSWDEDVEKCPDEGKWCDVYQDLCEGEECACDVMEIRRMQKSIDKVKGIADEMRRFGERHWMHDEGQNMRQFADRIDDTIKEFVKGESK